MKSQKTFKKLILYPLLTLMAVSIALFSFAAPASALDVCEELKSGTGGVLSCPDEGGGGTSFTEFSGGLTAPSEEGYSSGLTQATSAREFILNVTNFVLGFLGLIAVLIIIYGGFLYLTAAGEQEKAEKGKKSVTYAVIGMIIILGSFAIVSTVLQAPSGEETLKGAAETTEGVTTGSAQKKFNVMAARVQKMAADIVGAFAFHFDAQSDMNEVYAEMDATLDEVKDCQGGGCDFDVLDDFKTSMDNSIRVLRKIQNYIPGNTVDQIAINGAIDDLISAMNSSYNKGINEASSVMVKALFEGDDAAPFTAFVTEADFDAVINTGDDNPYNLAIAAVRGNFNSRINSTKQDLKQMYDQVGPITDVADDAFNKLVDLNYLQQDIVLLTLNALEEAGGSLEALEAAVKITLSGTPQQGSGVYTALYETLQDFTVLFNILQDLEFVDVKLTASTVTGNAPLAVNFSSVGSLDPSGITVTENQIEWDLDGDGTFSNSKLSDSSPYVRNCDESHFVATSCIYKTPGTYRVKLKISASDQTNDITNKPYNQEIGAGIAIIDVKVNPPQTKINLSVDLLEGTKDIVKYNDTTGALEVERSSILVPLSVASGAGIKFNAEKTTAKDGDLISQQAEEGATVFWDFGDDSTDDFNKTRLSATSGNLSVTHVFAEEGSYNVSVEFSDKSGIVDRKIFTVVVSSLVPAITISHVNPRVAQDIIFDGSDSISDNGQITSYDWSISPTITGLQNLTDESFNHAFANPNQYSVSLTVTDPIKTEGVTITKNFDVTSQPPVAQYTYKITDPTQPSTVNLDGSKSYDPDGEGDLEYLWEVNGTSLKNNTKKSEGAYSYDTSDPARPIIKFNSKDTFTVSLTAIDPNGGGTNVAQDSTPSDRDINITNTIDVAWGSDDNPTGNLKLNEATEENEASVSFTLASDNAVAYEIDFGDGEIEQGEMSKSEKITHIFKEAGQFIVQASVFDADDEENKIKRKVFISSSDTPSAVIGIQVNGQEVFDLTEPLTINRQDVITFDAGNSINTDGTGRRLKYSWDYGDGERGTSKITTHTYNDIGDYKITLKAVNENEVSQTSTDTIEITVAGEPPTLKSITAVPTQTDLIAPVTVQLTAIGAEDPDGKIVRYRWWYYDPANDQDELGVQVTQGPSATVIIGTRGSEGQERTYKFGVEMTDDENNTISSMEILSPSVVPTLEVTNGPNESPVAGFNVDRTAIMVGESINFTSSSEDPDGQIVSYFWDWEGDGFANNTTSEGSNVSHTFNTPATDGIKVRLKVRDNNESESTSDPVTIYIDSLAQPPVAAFTSEIEEDSTKVTFTDTSTPDELSGLTISKWNWDFDVSTDSNGDGSKDNDLDSTTQNPTNEYPDFGIYRAKLTVEDSTGQTSSITNFVNIKAPATAVTVKDAPKTLEARLLTTPQASVRDGKIHLTGDSGDITLDYSTSVGEITSYVIDKNINFDTNGNGIKGDDEDHKSTKAGKWTTDFLKEWGSISLKLTVTGKDGKTDSVTKTVVFDSGNAPASDDTQPATSTLGVSILDSGNNDILALLVSLIGFGILLLTLRRFIKER